MKIRVNDLDVEIRAGTPGDVPVLVTLIRAMAEFEKLPASVDQETLHSSLFGDEPAARTLLALVDEKPIGYATYFFSFSSMRGRRALWLDDLFIDPGFRGKGIGKAMMRHLARIAMQHRCVRFEWIVLDWNARAIEFYEDLGAEILPDWRICRVDEEHLPALAGNLDESPGAGMEIDLPG